MGHAQNKSFQQAPPPARDPLDIILDLRMTQKRLESDSRKALKEKEKNLQKAKQALAKNNEEGARMFVQTANSKQQESVNLSKMAQKIEFIQAQVKSTQANQEMMTQLQRVTPIMAKFTQEMPLEQVYSQMTQFDQALDDLMITGKVMDQMFNKDSGDVHSNMQVDMMLQQMKNEERAKMEEMQPQNTNQNFQNLQNLQQQQQPQQQYQPQQQQNYGQR